MKKLLITLSLAIACFACYAQNTFPGSGNVGVGTAAPTSDLHIWELTDSKPSGMIAPTKSILKLTRNGTPGYTYNESAEFRIGHGGPTYWGSQLDLFLNGGNNTTNVPDQQVMTWLYNGNVGIGNTNPNASLSIVNHTPIIQLFDLDGNPADGSSEGKIAFGSVYGEFASIEALRTGVDADDVTQLRFSTSYATGAGGDGDNIERMRLTPQGNLLINKTAQTNSSYKLDVAGSVRANVITVNTSGADFVFKHSYHLMPLANLKVYIIKYHRLPEIASAKKMQTDGLNVGENQTKLLQKVEELTLYLIEKDEQVKEQQQQIDKQQRVNTQQSQQLKSQQEQINLLIKQVAQLSQK